MDMSDRLQLPLLTAGQVQKDLFHNEALALLDLLVAGGLTGGPLSAPPANPPLGAAYLVGPGASGAFTGKDGQIAAWGAAGWRFVAPVEGMRLTDRTSGVVVEYWNGQWRRGSLRAEELVIGGNKVVGAAAGAIAAPSGGSVIDAEGRTCLALILAALRGHGLIAS